jgi:arylsulfatase A-like enzyme
MIEPDQFTPNIDRFAEEGLLFENTYSTSPWTLASISSWMTGGWPVESGGTYLNRRVYQSMTTLPEAMREEGYACGAFNCNPFMNPATALGRGFEKYWEFFHESHLSSGLLIDELNFYVQKKLDEYGFKESGRMIVDRQVGEAFDWLDTHKDEKFFLWMHLYDPHYPYTPPSPYKDELPDIGGERRAPSYSGLPSYRKGSSHHKYGLKRHIVNLYDAEIRFSDEVVGQVLDRIDELGLKEDTLVIILSDHGEEFFEHNGMEHGHTVYDEVLQVPLIFRLPGRIPPGKRISETVSLIDLYPTLLDFTGAKVEPRVYRGESLKGAIENADIAYAGEGRMNLNPGIANAEKSGEPSIGDKLENLHKSPWEPVIDASGELTKNVEIMLGIREKFEPPEGRIIFAEDLFYFDEDLQGIRIGDWKYIHSRNRFHDPAIFNEDYTTEDGEPEHIPDFVEGDELYNLADDPHELKNVIYEYPEMARYLRNKLKEIDETDRREGKWRKESEGSMNYFGAGLKNLANSLGYLDQ